MKNPRLLAAALSLIMIGIMGITISTWFAGKNMSMKRAFRMPDMMMGGGMMTRQQMKEMMNSMMPGMLPPGIKPENLPDRNGRGAGLLTRYCTQCHELPSPSMHTAEEWPVIAGRMFARLSMTSGGKGMRMMNMENPSAAEQDTIIDYLKEHSLKSITVGELPAQGSPGATLFKERCSQCHSLPDPKLHTADEWPGIIERMRANMKFMGRKPIAENEEKTMVKYLADHARR